MKRIVALLICVALIFTGCSQSQPQAKNFNDAQGGHSSEIVGTSVLEDVGPHYNSLDDPLLLAHIEDVIYSETVAALDSEKYFVESVSAVYVSKEYLEEVAFNSQSNIYFGYTLSELDALFQGTRYIFTLGDNGDTTVEDLQEIKDVTAETILKNVAIGVGVILVCVTVSVVSKGVGAYAIGIIFEYSAKGAVSVGLSSAAFGGISAGIVRGIQTGDFDEAIKAAALAGSEEFKWGAITGAILGGTHEAFSLGAATKSGLTMNEAARIQANSGLPIDVISQIRNYDEYLVYKDAGLKPAIVNGRIALIQNIDLDYMSQFPDGRVGTNLARMKAGYAPLDPSTGKPYQLHHIGQKADGTLAVLTESQHQGNSAILNMFGKDSEIDRNEFASVREAFWKYLGEVIFAN